MGISLLTRDDMRTAASDYWTRVHLTKRHRPATRKVLTALAARASKAKVDVWKELEKLDPATCGKHITATHIKAAFRSYMDELQGGRCCYCRAWLVNNAHARPIEHILPRAVYPQHSLCFWNLAVACADCNGIKSKKVWGAFPTKRRTYPAPALFTDFFHARFHRYDEHVRYIVVETNASLLTLYKGLTPQGRHLCTALLHQVAAQRTLYSSNPALRKSKKALDEYRQTVNADTPGLDAFQASLDAFADVLIG